MSATPKRKRVVCSRCQQRKVNGKCPFDCFALPSAHATTRGIQKQAAERQAAAGEVVTAYSMRGRH